MTHNLPQAGPSSFSELAQSPAHGPDDAHAHPGAPKPMRLRPTDVPTDTKSGPSRQQQARHSNGVPLPSPPTNRGKRPPDPGFPWRSQPAEGDEVLARQASFSQSWHHAVITIARVSGKRTTYDVLWDDDSSSRGLPLSRIRRRSPDTLPQTTSPPQTNGLVSTSTVPPPRPPHLAGPPLPRSPSPAAPDDLPLGTLVYARQSRHSQWYPATVLSHDDSHDRQTFTVQ